MGIRRRQAHVSWAHLVFGWGVTFPVTEGSRHHEALLTGAFGLFEGNSGGPGLFSQVPFFFFFPGEAQKGQLADAAKSHKCPSLNAPGKHQSLSWTHLGKPF